MGLPDPVDNRQPHPRLEPITRSVPVLVLSVRPGLRFDAATRTLSGTPTTNDSHTLVYRVAYADSDADTLEFLVTIELAPLEFDPLPVGFPINLPITSIDLPAATGGKGELEYFIEEVSAAASMNLDPGMRTLTMNNVRYVTFEYTVKDETGATDKMCLTTRSFGAANQQGVLFHLVLVDADNQCPQTAPAGSDGNARGVRGAGGDSGPPPPTPADGLPPDHPTLDQFYNYYLNKYSPN